MTEEKRNKTFEGTRDALPEELRTAFDELVQDYKYFALLQHGMPFVSYAVLSDLIKAGWRRSIAP